MARFRRLITAALVAGLPITAAASTASALTESRGAKPAVTKTATDKVTAIPNLTGIGTSVALNPTTAAALKSLGVSVAPYGSATFDAATSTITFPITSGYAEIHSDHSRQARLDSRLDRT